MNRRRWLTSASLCAILGTPYSAALADGRRYQLIDWKTDSDTIADEVLAPTAQYLDATPGATWRDYAVLIQDRLETVRDRIDPVSYQVYKHAIAAMNHELLASDPPARWPVAEENLHTKIDFAYSVVSLLAELR